MKKRKNNRLWDVIRNFLILFGLAAFTTTCCMLLFLYGTDISPQIIHDRAGLTFLNVLFLGLLYTLADTIRRYFTIQKPLKKILEATQKMRKGDFSIHLKEIGDSPAYREISVISDDINELAVELAGLETLRTDFIANVSHELKTPLSVIQNYATLLQDDTLPSETKHEYAKTVVQAARQLSSLITNILKLNKLENQQIYQTAKSYDLSEQLCECLLPFETVWEDKGITIDIDIEPEVIVTADEELMALVWNNLLSNAMKFTDKGGRVSLSLHKENNIAVTSVSDTGCGIASEIGEHIFEKFYQGDSSHAMQGNGLGLALVKRIVDITEADISVQSEVGKGSTFIVRLKGKQDG